MEEPTREPTQAEITVEVDKFLAGKPSKLTVTDVPPRIIKPLKPGPTPEGYYTGSAQYDAAGNLILHDEDDD